MQKLYYSENIFQKLLGTDHLFLKWAGGGMIFLCIFLFHVSTGLSCIFFHVSWCENVVLPSGMTTGMSTMDS